MALSRLGDFIELVEERNSDNIYKKDNVRGISTRKMFIPTKANLEGVSLSGYKLVPPLCFAYVSDTSRRGDKISLAFNDSSEEVFLVSSISTIFRVRQSADLNPYYLFMYFNRTEFDRYTRYNSWGSARETFSWDDMCDIEIDLPSLEEQQKVVDVYLSLVANQKAYEKGLDDLKLTCDAYIEELRRRTPQVKIGPYIYESNTKNENSIIKEAVGVGMKGIFTSKRTANKDSIESCKLVDKDDIVWATQTTCGIGLGAVDIYARDKVSMIAPTCNILRTDSTNLLPRYLLLWLKRTEFWRYALYYGSGVVDKFDFELMSNVEIPIPSLEIQNSIISIYNVYEVRKRINEKLIEQIKDICPILIRGNNQ